MENDFRNKEGYPDPVPYEAFCLDSRKGRRKHSYRPVVYICSAYRGDQENNVRKARTYCRKAVEMGAIPFAPHLLYPQFMDEGSERGLALFMGLVMLSKCSEIWVCGDVMTEGMVGEMDKAMLKGIKVRFFDSRMNEREKRHV